MTSQAAFNACSLKIYGKGHIFLSLLTQNMHCPRGGTARKQCVPG